MVSVDRKCASIKVILLGCNVEKEDLDEEEEEATESCNLFFMHFCARIEVQDCITCIDTAENKLISVQVIPLASVTID